MNIYPHFRLLVRAGPRPRWTLELSLDSERRVWKFARGPLMHAQERHLAWEISDAPDGAGGGSACWDAGPAEIRKWTPDHIVAVLHGAKLRGCFSLVRFRHARQPHWRWVRVRAGTANARPIHFSPRPVSAVKVPP